MFEMDTCAAMAFRPQAVILGGGDFPSHALPLAFLEGAERVVCCDGAAMGYMARTGRRPWAIVGDGDSLGGDFKAENADILHLVSEQDSNDQTKAVRFCKEQGLTRLVLLGASGAREDHTLGNISLCIEYMRMGLEIRMYTDHGVFIPCRDIFRGHADLPAKGGALCEGAFCGGDFRGGGEEGPGRLKGPQISIFSFGAHGLRSEGLKYPLHDLQSWWEGTLNEISAEEYSITADGDFLVYLCY